MQYDTELTRDELQRMTTSIAPTWRVCEASETAAGHHIVYRLSVETPDGMRDCYLKGTPEGKSPSVDLEARLLTLLDCHTTIPVPTVLGVVDEDDSLPTPFMLLEAMPGRTEHRSTLSSLSDDSLRAIARDTGRHLAALHRLDVVDAYGFLACDDSLARGDRPTGAFTTVTVADPIVDWRERLRDWASGTLAALEETRFADIVPEAEPIVGAMIDGIEGPFDPVLARIDNALENVLLEGDTVSAMLDWEFTIASTPGYDIVNVAWSLAGGPYQFAPDVPDRGELVRQALLDGYRDQGRKTIVDQTRANRDCYELLSALRSMHHLEHWYQLFDLDDQIDESASKLRTEVETRLRNWETEQR